MAVWGAGPVGQFAILSATIMGAQRVIAIDNVAERLAMAEQLGASPLNFDAVNVVEALNELTNGKGPDKCIDAVGLEAHATASLDSVYDRIKQAVMLEKLGFADPAAFTAAWAKAEALAPQWAEELTTRTMGIDCAAKLKSL